MNVDSKEAEKLYQEGEVGPWPIKQPKPFFVEGSTLRKPLTIYFNEKEWNTIDVHTKKIGVPKSIWMKYAVWNAIEEEQKKYFIK